MNLTQSKPRVIYLDILRIVSILGVICIHVVSSELINSGIGTSTWWWSDIFNALTRWGVPVFFMLSGALTLGSSKLDNIPAFLKSRIVKLGIPFLIWSIIYSLIKQTYLLGLPITFPEVFGLLLSNIIFDQSYYHLWFIYDIFIIYLISPFLRKIVIHSTEKELQYWLGLWGVATIFYIALQQTIQLVHPDASTYIRILNVPFVFGLSGYYILGYYLHNKTFTKKFKRILYLSAIVSIPLSIFGTYFLSKMQGTLNENLFGNFSLPTLLTSIALFVGIKSTNWKKYFNESIQNFIGVISATTFGIYLIHMLVILKFEPSLSFLIEPAYILYVLGLVFITFIVSFFAVKLMRIIPFIGKYLV